MIAIDVRGDMRAALSAHAKLSETVKARSVSRALNRAATTIRAEARKTIRSIYNVDAARITRAISLKRATPADLSAGISAKDVRLALSAFGRASLRGRLERARKTGRRVRSTITVRVRRAGGAKPVRGNPQFAGTPFLQNVGAGHLGIFQRVGRARYPFKELFSISVPGALTSRDVGRILRQVATNRFRDELVRDLNFRALGR